MIPHQSDEMEFMMMWQNRSLWQDVGDTNACTQPRWDVADGIASSDDGHGGRRFILE